MTPNNTRYFFTSDGIVLEAKVAGGGIYYPSDFLQKNFPLVGRNGSVGSAIRYGLEGPGDRDPVVGGAKFSATVQTGPWGLLGVP